MNSPNRLIALVEALEPHIDGQARQGGLECLSLALHSDSGALYQKSFGTQADAFSTDAPLFRIGSQSKALVVCCVMKLVQRGLISLNDPFHTYFPELTLPATSPLRRTSLLRLMRHQAPLSAVERPILKRRDGSYRSDLRRLGAWQLIRAISRGPNNIIGAGEAAFDYSDFGFALLAMVVERISGARFSDFALRNVLRSAGIETFFPGLAACPASATTKLVRGHEPDVRPPATDLGVLDPALGGIATAAATASLFHMLLTGGLLSPRLTRVTRDAAIAFGPPDKKYKYSPGLLHMPVGDGRARCIGHLGIFGGFCGITAYFPPLRLTVSLQMNSIAMQNDGGRLEIRQANPAGFVRGLFLKLQQDLANPLAAYDPEILRIWRESVTFGAGGAPSR